MLMIACFCFRFKLIKWWCQSFLVGIGTVVAGFRDDAGLVESVGEYPVKEIPRWERQVRDRMYVLGTTD